MSVEALAGFLLLLPKSSAHNWWGQYL
jgi:hypothetical protein